ncbi:GD19813 [Drosophila simulans]|uniref:GD19813 n=1 Tax=Drosophila simulans TaxID=7240 RepID=B4QXI6_DROSI|nr:GD19813 [Drosophila simulans]
MAELMHQIRDPAHTLGGSVGSIPQTLIGGGGGSHGNSNGALNGIHATPATNLKMSEAMRNAQHDTSPNPVSSKMKASKSYTHGLSSSSGTVNIPTSTSAQSNLSLLADISPNHTHFFEVMYVGKIRVSQKRVPNTFIDDALPKFKAYDAQRLRLLQNRKMSLSSEGGVGIEAKPSSSLKSHDLKEEDEEEQEQHKEQDDSQHSQAKPLVQLQLTGAEEGAAPRPLEDNKEKSPRRNGRCCEVRVKSNWATRSTVKRGKRNADELRELWRTAIRQTIMLNRMETENAMLQARQNENELKRIKLDYEEIVPCDKQLIERWEQIIERNSTQIGNKKDPKVLGHAIRTGVPRSKRGDVWTFLAEQHSMNTAPVDTKRFPNFNTPYHTLLKHLTEHQHAIFIDLGRTFPNHQFYKDPLGLGQLSLFNLLKAYSILDPELGYCQGLGFICGVLLLHCDEANAFQLLKHLMFRRNMRTKYLPDMKKFQLQLYQLSRLVKDHLPDLYVWLDQNDVSPTLYAAPWILTVFSSQFPLGFVARVFDLLFLESSDVIFKFAIALLSVHKQQLLAKDNFEEIMDYLKTVVPKMEHTCMEQIMKLVFSMDIGKQLAEYNVEYNVLQEEITTTNHHLEMLNREKTQNQHLEQQLQFAQSSIAQLETTRSSQQAQITTLQSQVQSLELTIQTLGRYVGQLVEHNPDLELPNEVRRMLQQLDDLDRQRRKPIFTERKIGKSVSVNSHLGFPLKVLEELTERDELGSPQKQKKEKTPFFEQLRQQQQQHRLNGGVQSSNVGESVSPTPPSRPNRLLDNASARTVMQVKLDELKLPEHVDKFVANIKSPLEVDSGVGTPLSPPSTASNSSGGSIFSRMGYRTTPPALSPLAQRQSYGVANTTAPSPQHMEEVAPATTMAVMPRDDVEEPQPMHPLSMVGGDVNVRFKGTTQLKSIRPVHHMRAIPLGGVQHPSSTEPAVRVAPVPVELAPPAATATTGRS